MLLAGALVPFREMNRGLFEDSDVNRERGGAPVPAAVMPLRYAYEAHDRHPGDPQSVRARAPPHPAPHRPRPRRRTPNSHRPPPNASKSSRPRSPACSPPAPTNPREAPAAWSHRIGTLARSGTRIEVETLEVWPEDSETARPCSEFFVNDRIDLMVRQAESYRTDYRNTRTAQRLPRREKILRRLRIRHPRGHRRRILDPHAPSPASSSPPSPCAPRIESVRKRCGFPLPRRHRRAPQRVDDQRHPARRDRLRHDRPEHDHAVVGVRPGSPQGWPPRPP